ncbi:translation initiation factor eIF3 subunit [Exophiala xenobiotica]|nr:translation initiation factor eIF3 subunit [Exophiala xenobiotica]
MSHAMRFLELDTVDTPDFHLSDRLDYGPSDHSHHFLIYRGLEARGAQGSAAQYVDRSSTGGSSNGDWQTRFFGPPMRSINVDNRGLIKKAISVREPGLGAIWHSVFHCPGIVASRKEKRKAAITAPSSWAVIVVYAVSLVGATLQGQEERKGRLATYSVFCASPADPANKSPQERSLKQIKYNKDGDLLFSVAKDKVICAWFTSNGERLGKYTGHQGAIWTIQCLAQLPNPRF